MFVTLDDFNIIPYRIPSMSAGEEEEFQSFVDEQEEFYLKEVLGDNLYDAFTNGLEDLPSDLDLSVATVIGTQYVYGNDVWEALTVTTGVIPTEGVDFTLIEANNRWLLLKNGNTYLVDGKYYRWVGMVKTLKALIFSKWVEYTAIKLTGNGFVTPKVENNYPANPNQQICRAWNDWSHKVGGPCEVYNTLYGYLYYTNLTDSTFDDTFDETFQDFNDYLAYEFTPQGQKNIFDL